MGGDGPLCPELAMKGHPPPSDSSLIPGSCCSRPPLTTKMLQASQPAPNSCLSSQISFYQCFICIERDLHAKQYFGNILQLLLLKFLREAASRRPKLFPNWIISKPNKKRFSMGILIIPPGVTRFRRSPNAHSARCCSSTGKSRWWGDVTTRWKALYLQSLPHCHWVTHTSFWTLPNVISRGETEQWTWYK